VTALQLTDTGVANGVTYFYQVVGVNAGGSSPRSAEASATPVAVPPAPTGVTATSGNAQVQLSWQAAPGAATYRVKRATTSGGPYADVAGGVATPGYLDTAVTNGTTYFYVVSAASASGKSPDSAEASATPTAPPAAPTGLSATAGNAQIHLTWSSSAGASSYQIYRATASGGEGNIPYRTGVTAAEFTDTGLTNGTTYFYQVAAVNAGGSSPRSAEASATPVAPPPAPSGVAATPADSQVRLTWNASPGAASYTIYRGQAAARRGPRRTRPA